MKTELELKTISDNLANPKGDIGLKVAAKMNESNLELTLKSIEALSPKKNDSVVEIGLGNGKLSYPILEKIGTGGVFLGVDTSQTMIDESFANISSRWEGELILYHGDICDYKTDLKFDKLMGVNLLYFIEDLDQFFTHLKPLMKDGAKLVFSMRAYETLVKLPISQFNFILRPDNEIMTIIENNGFKNITLEEYVEKNEVKRQVETDVVFKNIIISCYK